MECVLLLSSQYNLRNEKKNDSLAGLCFSTHNKKNTRMVHVIPARHFKNPQTAPVLSISQPEWVFWMTTLQRRVCSKPCRYFESLNKFLLQEEWVKILGNELKHIAEIFFKRFHFYIKWKGCHFKNVVCLDLYFVD